VPRPRALLTSMVPPMSSTSGFTIERPSPVPVLGLGVHWVGRTPA
jgi:hypothetical protein